MILAQVRDELNQVNWLLDEYETLRDKRKNREERAMLVRRALFASTRGVEALIEDQRTNDPLLVDDDVYRALEELRQDEALLRLFIKAESRLLKDLGVTAEAIARIEQSLADVLLDLKLNPEPETGRLDELLHDFEEQVLKLEKEGRDQEVIRRLLGAIQTLGGGLVVAANGIAGIATTAGSAGTTVVVSAAGAALSISAGTEVMNRGAAKAMGA